MGLKGPGRWRRDIGYQSRQSRTALSILFRKEKKKKKKRKEKKQTRARKRCAIQVKSRSSRKKTDPGRPLFIVIWQIKSEVWDTYWMNVWTLMLRSWRPKGKYHDEKNNSREDRELGSGAGQIPYITLPPTCSLSPIPFSSLKCSTRTPQPTYSLNSRHACPHLHHLRCHHRRWLNLYGQRRPRWPHSQGPRSHSSDTGWSRIPLRTQAPVPLVLRPWNWRVLPYRCLDYEPRMLLANFKSILLSFFSSQFN